MEFILERIKATKAQLELIEEDYRWTERGLLPPERKADLKDKIRILLDRLDEYSADLASC